MKRKGKRESDGKSLATGSDDAISHDVEVVMKPKKPKRKKGDVESSNTTKKENPGPYVCRFCGEDFQLSQALGGHMNRHRFEKQDEEMQKAKTLIAQRQQFIVGNSWIMQGGGSGGGGNLYYGGPNPPGPVLGSSLGQFYLPNQSATTLQNPQLNPVLAAHQNAQVSVHSLQGQGYHNPLDNTMTHYHMHPQGNNIPRVTFQGADIGQHHGHSVGVHSNQGGLSDALNLDMPSNQNQQPQTNTVMESESSFYQSAVQFVDQHGNDPLQQHELLRRSGHEFAYQSTTWMESGQGSSFQTDTSIDDHTSQRLP